MDGLKHKILQMGLMLCNERVEEFQIKRDDISVLFVWKKRRKNGGNVDTVLTVKCRCCGEIREIWEASSYNKGRFFCKEKIRKFNSNLGTLVASKYTSEQKRLMTAHFGILSTTKPNPKDSLVKSGSTSIKLTNTKILSKFLNSINVSHSDPEETMKSIVIDEICGKYPQIKQENIKFITISKNSILEINGTIKRHKDFINYGLFKRKISSLEQQFRNYADKIGIKYEEQFNMQTRVINPNTKHIMPLDFKVNDVHIETDGQMHFVPFKITNKTSKDKLQDHLKNFKKRLHLDKIKNNECLTNNIKLLRFPYFMGHQKMEEFLSYVLKYNGTVSSFISIPYKIPAEIVKEYYENRIKNS